MPMATIKDVAREAGASISTVSKALNGSYTISAETTEHIKQVAARLGYRPNARAQMLARKATRSIVFLAEFGKNTAFENPHMFEILSGAESALREKDYAVTLQHCNTKDVCHLSKEIMNRKSADGLLIHASVVTKELSLMLSREEVPHMIIGKPDFTNNLCWIDNDNSLSGELAARKLKELGHKKILLIAGLEDDHISEDRCKGIRIGLGSLELAAVFRGFPTIEEGRRMGLEALELPERATAVICTNNFLAVGCLRAFARQNVKVPEDMSLITFDDYPFAKFTDPPLTTVSIDLHDLGVQAGKMLMVKIRKPSLHVQSYSTLPTLIERQSTAMVELEGG